MDVLDQVYASFMLLYMIYILLGETAAISKWLMPHFCQSLK